MIKPLPNPAQTLPDGLILAGGQARRFAGKEKGLVDFHGLPMVAHVAQVFQGKVNRLLISANQSHARYQPYADQVVSDTIGDQWGPLAGIYTGLINTTADRLLVATCDQPLLPADYVQRMIEPISDNPAILVAVDPHREHYLNLLLPVNSADHLHEFLTSGQRRVQNWLEAVGYHKVVFPVGCLDSVNSPAELADLERHGDEDAPTNQAGPLS